MNLRFSKIRKKIKFVFNTAIGTCEEKKRKRRKKSMFI